MKTACPSCGFTPLERFYEALGVPVHSCLMMPTEREAEEFPLGDVVCAFCRRCGFITNVSYDPAFRDYAPGYEDQQSYSPTFNAFARRLAQQLVDRYDLHGRDIVEIGCGKGDFLALLCGLGDNRGVGIDPAVVGERIEGEAAGRITLIQDYYSEKYAGYTGDLVLCRHTLEHIDQPAHFLETLRRGIGERLETAVFFEVPDTIRVLRERAFWDIYYEHCSYWTPGSLARLFRRCGFAVLDIGLDFNDQYLLLHARPVEGPSDTAHGLEEGIEELSRDVERFREECAETVAAWRESFERWATEGTRVAIWGSGSKCVAFLTTLGVGEAVGRVIDINPHRHHRFLPGSAHEVLPPESLSEFVPDVVVVMNPVYRGEIEGMLAEMDLEPEIVTV